MGAAAGARPCAKLVAGRRSCLLVLALSVVLRPLIETSGRRPLATAALPAPASGNAGADQADGRPRRSRARQSAPLAYEQQLAQARTLVSQDPKRVAQVVRTWVAGE